MKKKAYPVFTAKSAVRDYNKKAKGFQDIVGRMRVNQTEAMPAEEAELKPTLDVMLNKAGFPATFAVKSSLARSFGMHNYSGTKEQDDSLMMSLQAKLEHEANEKTAKDGQEKEKREHSYKERELGLREKELAQKNAPTADDIADSLIKRTQ